MVSPQAPLTIRHGVMIASRALCALAIFYALGNLVELPSYVVGLIHYANHGDGASTTGTYYPYWTAKYVGWIGMALLRAAIESWLAMALYRCGPRVSRYLIGEDFAPDVPAVYPESLTGAGGGLLGDS